MTPLCIGIIIGSTRDGRFSEHVHAWIKDTQHTRSDCTFTTIDLRNYALPFLTDKVNPSKMDGVYTDPEVTRFAESIKQCDSYLIITPEYNHAYPAVLKNAIDHIKGEWYRKPVSIIAYGTLGGGRAAEQLKLVMLDMASVITKHHVHIIAPWNLRNEDGSPREGALHAYTESLEKTLEENIWWARTLNAARYSES